MSRTVQLRSLAFASAVYLVTGCGAPAANGPAASTAPSTTVLSRDEFGQVVQGQNTPAVNTESPAWLAGLEEGDILSYRVETPDSHPVTVQVRVERMRRVDKSAAALLVPNGNDVEGRVKPHWIAGDSEGLYELQAHESLLDPGFTPLDPNGRVIDSGRNGALWRVPQSWDEIVNHDQAAELGGWAVEELDLTLDGPVRGDRCTRISKVSESVPVRMTVCANLGMVDLQRGNDQIAETWELVEIVRVAAE